jgi:Tol biopolymer transport system component
MVGQFARWSPKGDQFAYSDGRSLKVSRSDGSHPRTVAQITGYIEDAAWAPDGTRLRFTVSLTNSRRIWEVRLDGRGLRLLFADWTEPFTEMGSWTRDGKYFIFSAGHTAHDLWVRRETRLLSLERDSAPVPLTTGPFWALQPQPVGGGQKVYFVGTSNIGQLVRLDARSGQWLAFLDGIDAAQVDYSADGKWITYADSNGCLWRSAADGSHRIRLTSPPFFARNPRWSPDGNRILYYGAPLGQNDVIYVMPSSGGAITRLTPRDTKTSEGDATWSPDGTGIIYGSISQEADRKPYLYRMDLRTGRIKELPGTARLWSPRWSPDGKYVAALDQASNLTLYSIVTHEAATLTSFAAGYPTWSRESRYIYFENNSSSAWYRVGIGERRVELLRRLNGLRTAFSSAGWLGMTPDGTPISSRAASSSNVYALEWQDR